MTALRYLCLAAPLGLTLLAATTQRRRDERAAALLSFVAAAVGLAVLQEAAVVAGWYAFAPVDGAFRGMPVDVWIGWAALWGPAPVLLRRVLPLPVALGLLLWLDVVSMPLLNPLVQLGPRWLVGEAVGLLTVALPAQLLGRWSAQRRHLGARTLLQVAVFAAVLLWLVPTVAFELGDGSWQRLTQLPRFWLLLTAQVALLLAVPALSAVREFAVRGGGTPYPWDPPHRLVTTGPYAYVANPMQLSAVALVLLTAAATRSVSLAGAALVAVAFSAAVARPHEEHELRTRYGRAWHRYRRDVHDWRPRRTPYRGGGPAVLWLDDDCGPCAAVGRFLHRHAPRQLAITPAAEHDAALWRARYAGDDGHRERGVAAVARALDHVNLGWAYLGWLVRLPGVCWLAQLVTDALIAPPHPARLPTTGTAGEECPTRNSACSTGLSPPSASTASPASRPAPSPRPPG